MFPPRGSFLELENKALFFFFFRLNYFLESTLVDLTNSCVLNRKNPVERLYTDT